MTLPEIATSRWSATEGLPFPLGPTRIEEEDAYNFALYSKHAERVTLLLYTKSDIVNPVLAYRFDYLKKKTGRIWHCRIPLVSMRGAPYYAYRVEGPTPSGRFEWQWFDRNKILLDPYAKSVFFPPAFNRLAATRPGSNAGKAPLGVLTGDSERFDWQGDHRPRHESDTVIYESHVGGFTKNPNSGVKDGARGTFAGLIEEIPYLKELGVTVVELMSVSQYDPSDGNYGGYMPLNFSSSHHGYLSDHTGPLYSYKGIDNSTYYLMADRPGAPYENFSGTGNTLNCANRSVRNMIMDSVRHWAHDVHVDGFYFDLASLFTRNPDGSVNANDVPLLSDMASDPNLALLRLIAEPWDAAGMCQLGRVFPGIMACQWNGRYGVESEPDLAYDSRSLAFALHGGSQQDLDIYVMINAYWEELTFQIQEGAANAWRRVVDSSRESPFDFLEPGNESPLQSLHCRVPGRAVIVLVCDQDGGSPQ